MKTRLLSGLLAAGLLAGAGVGLSKSPFFQNPQDPDGPNAPRAPVAAAHTSTLMLTVQIDANGIAIQQAIRKPNLEFAQPKNPEDMPFRWSMRDAQGNPVAEGGFDPARLCLDPTHLGQPPHVEGDLAVPHVTHTNIKVPDLAAFDHIEFVCRDQGVARAFGTALKSALVLR